jgi:glycosyltransferase involved in cell wall biosynthesis
MHVVENLDRGAVETWLVRMLETGRASHAALDWTFYCALPESGRLDERARELGATVIHSPVALHQTWRFCHALRRTLTTNQYDVFHCHHDIVSAVYLLASAGLPIPWRIVHVHNADEVIPTRSRLKTALLREPMRRLAIGLSDSVVGISNHTLNSFLRGRPRRHGDSVVYYGADLEAFHAPPPSRENLRRQLDLPADARIILFASRMVSYKNPLFVLEILAQLRSDDDVFAVFVGTGPLEGTARDRARAVGLSHRVRVLGWRDDVKQLMRAADVFLFPRVEHEMNGIGIEGLGLVVVEAQAAGLPVVISHGIPRDAIVAVDQCSVLSLNDGPRRWADEVRKRLGEPRLDPELALRRVEASAFEPHRGFEALQRLHDVTGPQSGERADGSLTTHTSGDFVA